MKVILNGFLTIQNFGRKHSYGNSECSKMHVRGSQTFLRKVVPTGAKTLATTLLVLSTLSSCQKLRDNFRPDELDLYKIPFPTEDYTLENSGCDWDFNNLTRDSIYVVNSDLELMALVSCSGSSMPPEVDFDRYTLLFVYGNANFFDINKSFRRVSKNEYQLTVEMTLDDSLNVKQWHTALLVPKLPQNAVVAYKIIEHKCEDTIPFTDYPISPFGRLTRDSLYVINSDAELLTITANIPSPIDWNNNTLLYAGGPHLTTVHKIDTVLLGNYCTHQYTLNVALHDYGVPSFKSWHISILTPKIHNNTDITLNIQYVFP